MADDQQSAQQNFSIQKIYIKDISFETPNSPHAFREQWDPEVSLQLGNTGKTVGDGLHEVILTLTVTAKNNDKTAYLAEVQQAGIFTIHGYSQEDVNTMVGSYCPGILFPFARETVCDLVSRGGFPQLLLAPINFEALYRQHLNQAQAQQAEADASQPEAGESKHLSH